MNKIDKKVDINNQELSKLKKYALWAVEKKTNILLIFASLLLIGVLNVKINPLINKKSSKNLFLVHQKFADWKNSSYKDKDKLNELKSVIKKYPNMKPSFEGLIIQNLLINNDLRKEDSSFANNALQRTKSELPFYYEFSNVALLINDSQFKEALNKSNDLKTKMLNDQSFLKEQNLPAGPVLYALNLIRIAFLEGKLNDNMKELMAWHELEDYLGLNSSSKINDNIQNAKKALQEIFSENNIELIDYINYRKNSISSKF